MRLAVIVVASGQEDRMASSIPKLLHPLAGRPLIDYAVTCATEVAGAPPVVVLEHGSESFKGALEGRVRSVRQARQPGAARAVFEARNLIVGQTDLVLVIRADMPLLSTNTLRHLVEAHLQAHTPLTLLTPYIGGRHDPGQVEHTPDGRVQAVVAKGDRAPEQRAIRDLSTGVYCFAADWLWDRLAQLLSGSPSASGLAGLVALAMDQGAVPGRVAGQDPDELLTIDTRVHLAEAERVLRGRINRRWMEAGVTLMDPATTYIDADVSIGQDTTILPNTYLMGQTVIGGQCRIGPNSLIEDCQIGDRCVVRMSVLESAQMEDDADIGPFGHLRKGARVCRGAHMGNFGELKNATLGPGSMMGHFSYLGDAVVGANVNIGAGTITCNFDGTNKNRTVIEDDAFIGSDSMLVAPVRIGRGAKTGAGSVVTRDVPAYAVAYGVPARVKYVQDEAAPEAAEE